MKKRTDVDQSDRTALQIRARGELGQWLANMLAERDVGEFRHAANLWDAAAERGRNPVLQERIDELERQRLALVSQRSAAADVERAARERGRERHDFLTWCRKAVANIDEMPYPEKRNALEATRVRVRVWPLGHAHRAELSLSTPVSEGVYYL